VIDNILIDFNSIEEESEEADLAPGAEVRAKDFERPDFDSERCK